MSGFLFVSEFRCLINFCFRNLSGVFGLLVFIKYFDVEVKFR